ncbi:MAG: hypothetical protein HYW91_03550 [Candidatus Sungbacteria bacterium]|nr:hypothetical protein [Candidatus Sungbacteria bacterium]
MEKPEYFLKSFINAAGVFIYVSAIALFLSNAKGILGDIEDVLFIPVFMLLLFIISATVTSLLVLGKPLHLYLTGLKKEAIALLLATLAWLVFFLVIVATVLLLQ